MVIVIGGDGTHRGASVMQEEVARRKLKICIAGVPKTIDNDIPLIDTSFGYMTSVAEATKAIEAAEVEAMSAENGIGLVKLMGRSAGHIALGATLGNRAVNILLVPEFNFELYGKDGLLEWIEKRVTQKGHAVIVVAEGAGDAILDGGLNDGLGTDESGNKRMSDIGIFLRDTINKHFKGKGLPCT